MKIKQIFSAYHFADNEGIKNIRFCPVCGAEFRIAAEGGRERPVCPECGFVYYRNPAPGVSVLIIENNCVLLGKRAPGSFAAGKWCLPCGFIEYNEDFLSAAVREVKEETGLTVAIQSIINVNSNFLAENLHSIAIILSARVIAGTPAAGDDLESIAWFDLSGSLPEMAFVADQEIIERYSAQKIEGLPVDTDFLNTLKSG
jgi:ADP-ribose pyrophosphatase YjhB (NUDIX family)